MEQKKYHSSDDLDNRLHFTTQRIRSTHRLCLPNLKTACKAVAIGISRVGLVPMNPALLRPALTNNSKYTLVQIPYHCRNAS